MVEDHSDSERGNPLPPHGLLQRFFYMHHSTDRITHTTAFVTPVVENWLEREIAQWFHYEGSIRRPIAPVANALITELHPVVRSGVPDITDVTSVGFRTEYQMTLYEKPRNNYFELC